MTKVEKTKENLHKCKCFSCPSYTFACFTMSMPTNTILLIGDMDKIHAEKLFCAYEKSTCIKEEKGCICYSCDVHKENGLDKTYYCTVTEGK